MKRVCAWCGKYLDEVRTGDLVEIVSHGICPYCKERMLADLNDLPVVEPTNRTPPPSAEIDEECST